MPDRRSLSPVRLLAVRASARAGLLTSAAATAAVAVATVCLVLAWLAGEVAAAGDPPPPGVSEDAVADAAALGAAALSSAAVALVLLVAILAATAVAQLARLTAAAREHESATIRARGFSRPQAWAADAAEAVVVALVGAATGVLLALAVAALAGVAPGDVLTQWPWALATALLLAAVFAVALRRGESRRTSARGARATTAALIVIVLLASAFVVWQLPNARGTGFDPVVAIAPAVLLMTGALVALAAFGAIAVAWSRPAAAAPGLEPGYPARQVARRLQIYAVAALLVALTISQAVFSSAYAATWTAMTTDSAAVLAGADLRVDMSPQSASTDDMAAASAVAGVDAASPALAADIEIGAVDAQVVALPASAIETVVSSAGGLVDRNGLMPPDSSAEPVVQSDPVSLGEGATGIRVTAEATAAARDLVGLALVALVLDAGGTPQAVPLDGRFIPAAPGEATLIAEAELPDSGTGPWSLLAIVAEASRNTTLAVDRVEALGAGEIDASGDPVFIRSGTEAVVWLADGGVLAANPQIEGAGVEDGLPPVAATASTALAETLGLGIGDLVEFRYAGTGREGEAVISSIVDVVPGASSASALFVPMGTLMTSQLQRGTSIVPPNSVWAAGDPSSDDAMSAALGDRPVRTTAPGIAQALVGALVPGWWIATAGSVVLSLVAAFAIVQTLEIARRRELGVLRALGVTASRQARMRAGELAGVFGAALVLGAAAGWVVSWLIVPEMVRAVTPGILTIAGGVDVAWAPLAVAAGALLIGLAVILAFAGAGVRRVARQATVGEEAR